MSSSLSGVPPAELETRTCRHCLAGILRIPGGWWGAATLQRDLWGPMPAIQCPGRGLVFGFRQPHVPRPVPHAGRG